MTCEEALEYLRRGLSRIAYWDGATCACGHCPSCEARALLIQVEADGDLGRALEAESPCACGGKKPLVEVDGWMTRGHLNSEDTNAICIWQFPEGQDWEIMIHVHAIILPTKEEAAL